MGSCVFVCVFVVEKMSADNEMLQNVSDVCQQVKQVLACVEEVEVPDDLDSLIFLVDELYCLLLVLDLTSNDLLDSVAVGLSLQE